MQVSHIGQKTAGKSAKQSGKDLSLFNEFHRYLHGSASKKYVKNIDSIPEFKALEIQKKLEAEFGDLVSMRNHFERIIDKAVDKFEYEVVGTATDIMKVLGIRMGNPSEGNIGELPNHLIFNHRIIEMAEKGELSSLIPSLE